ncbi:MAG TPA: peptidase domain-containing ABC transporter [Mycobacteriales bacterium]|nr:peptidase domain-containing ABC transporter [Mycobacteriales bacterium]
MRRPRAASRPPRLRLVRQLEVGDCGAACLAIVLRSAGHRAELSELRDLTSTGREGVSAAGIVSAARALGFTAKGVRCPADRLAQVPAGSILHWGGNHFVVLERVTSRGAVVLDPALGRRTVPAEALGATYSGVALVFEPPAGPVARERSTRTPRRRLAPYRPFVTGTAKHATLAVVFAVAVQACLLANPYVLRRVVGGLAGSDPSASARTLAVGVAAMAVGYLGAAIARLGFLVALQRAVDFRLTMGVLEHLVAQPYSFIARRSSGDLSLRLRSTVIVRQVLTSGALSTLIDGALVLVYVVLISVIDLWFGLLTTAAIAAQALVVAVAWPRLRSASAVALEAQTVSQGQLLEIVGGLEQLKASGTAGEVVHAWSGRLRTEVDTEARRSRLGGLVDALLLAIRFAAPPLLLALGLARVGSGALDLADMLALATLSAAVTVPTGGLLSTLCSLSTVGSYVERLDDLLHASPERVGQRGVGGPLAGAVELQDVSFRYSALLPPALSEVSLRIEPGEQVAVVGASGSGKTTLAMVIATLHEPSTGSVIVDGHDARDYDLVELRRHIGVVTQSAPLFALTIHDNIALGRPHVSEADVIAAAKRAALHDEVVALPAGYRTKLGNDGSGLSGGQRQRIALARALVHSPGLLILDEATSALDSATEARVHEGIAELDCTRIVVSHRLSNVVRADRVIVMKDGRIVADGSPGKVRRTSAEFRGLVEPATASTKARRATRARSR